MPEGTEMTTKKPKKPQTFRAYLPDGPIVTGCVDYPCLCEELAFLCPTMCIEKGCPFLPLEV